MDRRILGYILLGMAILSACTSSDRNVLRMATTTSTYDSGLLDEIIPDFEEKYDARVDIIAVGTGQAIAIAERGDVDVILVHNRNMEERFISQGYGLELHPVMYNDYVLLGPKEDPARIQGVPLAASAMAMIADQRAGFASRGDDSGTHAREMALWEQAGFSVEQPGDWYKSLGQGMAETLRFADEQSAYTLSDRGTYQALRDKYPHIVVIVGGETLIKNTDPSLLNPYSVIAVNPDRHSGIASDLAEAFIEWLCSDETQERIASYGLEEFGKPLFYPYSGCRQKN